MAAASAIASLLAAWLAGVPIYAPESNESVLQQITRQSYACSEAKVVPPKARLDRFQSITGKLLYLTNARPDIALAVGMCTRCMSCPDDNMMLNCERIAMYCAQTASLGLHYRPGMAPEINCEWAPTRGPSFDGGSDADWSVNRSTSGYCFLMGGAVVSYGSKKQNSIALSSSQAEIQSGSLASCEALFLRMLMTELGFPPKGPTIVRMDNSGAIAISESITVDWGKMKHVSRKHLHIRELVQKGLVKVKYVSTKNNVADIFTKPLERRRFQLLRCALLGA